MQGEVARPRFARGQAVSWHREPGKPAEQALVVEDIPSGRAYGQIAFVAGTSVHGTRVPVNALEGRSPGPYDVVLRAHLANLMDERAASIGPFSPMRRAAHETRKRRRQQSGKRPAQHKARGRREGNASPFSTSFRHPHLKGEGSEFHLEQVESFKDLERAVVSELSGRGLLLRAQRRHDGIHLREEDSTGALIADRPRVGIVKPDRAEIEDGGPTIHGNFSASGGKHWDELRRRLRGPDVETEFPTYASKRELSDAIGASAAIAISRTRDFGHSVVVRQADRSVRFEPIPDDGVAQVAFRFERGDEFLEGALRLKALHDPLAIAVFDRSEDPSVVLRAWLFALCAYAELTCVPSRDPSNNRHRERKGTAGHASPVVDPQLEPGSSRTES